MTVDAASAFFTEALPVERALGALREVGLGYLRLGQPATELSGGEAQRIKLATELQRLRCADTLYVLDEPTTGLHPADVDRLLIQLQRLVDSGATVIVVEHDMRVIAASDWVIDMGPGAGDEGRSNRRRRHAGELMRSARSRTAPYLRHFFEHESGRSAGAEHGGPRGRVLGASDRVAALSRRTSLPRAVRQTARRPETS